uniref:C-type lectin domain-containing protein n=1 Tax=Monopterus albus TaxID=43700 RepID=A0A3Q3KRH6_MONAL
QKASKSLTGGGRHSELGQFRVEDKNWSDAQHYCRQHYTDLSFVRNQNDQDKLQEAAGKNDSKGWIGLHRDPNNNTHWIWSGGEDMTYQNWADNEPNNCSGIESTVTLLSNGKWNDANDKKTLPFYCVHIVTFEVKSWEEALEHCRLNHGDLPSLLNETEDNLALNKINQTNITDPVWIGLRYLNDRWLWVNGDPLVYEHWAQGGGEQDHQCPIQKRCGALSTKGWESLDCQNKLNFICTRKTDDTPSDKLFKII